MEKELAGEQPISGQAVNPELRDDGELDENDLETINGGSISQELHQAWATIQKVASEVVKTQGDALKNMAAKG